MTSCGWSVLSSRTGLMDEQNRLLFAAEWKFKPRVLLSCVNWPVTRRANPPSFFFLLSFSLSMNEAKWLKKRAGWYVFWSDQGIAFLDPLGFVLEGKELLFFCQRCVQMSHRYSSAHSTADQNLSALGGIWWWSGLQGFLEAVKECLLIGEE